MVELRGIEVSYLARAKKVKLVVRGERGDDYTTLTFPAGKPLTFGTILTFLCKKFKCKPKDVRFPEHIKIPK